jgi:hypothetical protein
MSRHKGPSTSSPPMIEHVMLSPTSFSLLLLTSHLLKIVEAGVGYGDEVIIMSTFFLQRFDPLVVGLLSVRCGTDATHVDGI